MKTWKFLLCSLTLVLGACSKPESISDAAKPQTRGQESDGTFWTGGGNGVGFCKPLESCRYYPETKEDFIRHLAPVMRLVESKSPAMAVELRETLSKAWYMGPEGLKEIPSTRIGLSFRSDDQVQLALQSKWEIWIARDSFNKLPTLDRARLIMHEMIMAIKVGQVAEGGGDFWGDWRNGKRTRDLTAEDYQAIRTLTGDLVDGRLERLNPQQFVEYVTRLGFKQYRPGSAEFPIGTVLTQKNAYEVLEGKKALGQLPREGLLGLGGTVEKGACAFQFDFAEEHVRIAVLFAKAGGAVGTERAVEFVHNSDVIRIGYDATYGIHFELAQLVPSPKLGAQRHLARFTFAQGKVQRVGLVRQVYVFEVGAGGYLWRGDDDVKAIDNITCGSF